MDAVVDLPAVVQIVPQIIEQESAQLEQEVGYRIVSKQGDFYFVVRHDPATEQTPPSAIESVLPLDHHWNLRWFYVEEQTLYGPYHGPIDINNTGTSWYPAKTQQVPIYFSGKREETDWAYADKDTTFNDSWYYAQSDKLVGPFTGPTEYDSRNKPWYPTKLALINLYIFSDENDQNHISESPSMLEFFRRKVVPVVSKILHLV